MRGQFAETGLCVWLELRGTQTITTRLPLTLPFFAGSHSLQMQMPVGVGVRQLQTRNRKTIGSGEDYG